MLKARIHRFFPSMIVTADIVIPAIVFSLVFTNGLVLVWPENLLTCVLSATVCSTLASTINLVANLSLHQRLTRLFGTGLHYGAVRAAMNVCVTLAIGLFVCGPHA